MAQEKNIHFMAWDKEHQIELKSIVQLDDKTTLEQFNLMYVEWIESNNWTTFASIQKYEPEKLK